MNQIIKSSVSAWFTPINAKGGAEGLKVIDDIEFEKNGVNLDHWPKVNFDVAHGIYSGDAHYWND